jgi:hypothetical protein
MYVCMVCKVICTPGRILDHLRNSHSVTLDDLDVLVLDEVDKLLDMVSEIFISFWILYVLPPFLLWGSLVSQGFQEEVEELVRHCPLSRQTMLFSATMTAKVEDLAKLSLKRPIRVKTAALEGECCGNMRPHSHTYTRCSDQVGRGRRGRRQGGRVRPAIGARVYQSSQARRGRGHTSILNMQVNHTR